MKFYFKDGFDMFFLTSFENKSGCAAELWTSLSLSRRVLGEPDSIEYVRKYY